MDDNAHIPTVHDLASLRDELEAARKKLEYDQLKRDLYEITCKAAVVSNEFSGVMQLPDSEQNLKTKNANHVFAELLLDRLRRMFSLRPIVGNIIALLISVITLFYIFNEVNIAGFEQYQAYFAIGIQLFAAIQIIKSATRGLLLPFLALTVGSYVSHSLSAHDTLFNFNIDFYQHLMIVGIIGLGVSVLSID